MTLPRWTAYVALGVLSILLVTAIPTRRGDPADGEGFDARERAMSAAEEESRETSGPAGSRAEAPESGIEQPTTFPRLVVLGIDGMDPELLEEAIERFPDRMPNFKRLIEDGAGIHELGTSTPPQSPVAWSNFSTGRNPGGHGVFDFIHRNPKTRATAPSTVTEGEGHDRNLPGKWKFPSGSGGDTNRSGRPFWALLADRGIPADIWRMPINYPVEPSLGVSFPGMMTPALDSAYGEFTLYSTDPPVDRDITGGKIVEVQERGGIIRTSIIGPPNAFIEGDPAERVPLDVYIDRDAGAAALEIGSEVIVLRPGEWSDFTTVAFDLLPLGAMQLSGIVRFYLRSLDPEVELYASPINFDPHSPVEPVSQPEEASSELADAIGLYYTQGMAEEVAGLKTEVLSDAEFMDQAELVYEERGRMLDYALERYMANEDGGFLFFYYSTIDLCCHMMWRHKDEAHPAHDPVIASQDSSAWSQRPGSTWKDVVFDLYVKMDPVLGEVRERVGADTRIVVMSDHGFAPYHYFFNLNTWLYDNGYLVLREGGSKELARDDPEFKRVFLFDTDAEGEPVVDWTKTKAYGIGFNALYLNLEGREEGGCVTAAEKEGLISELKQKLESVRHAGQRVVIEADRASDVYTGERLAEAPDLVVGYNAGYGNSDASTTGRIPNATIEPNEGGTFNGNHLMHPSVVNGLFLANRAFGRPGAEGARLEDLTVEILKTYDIQPDPAMDGRPAFEKP